VEVLRVNKFTLLPENASVKDYVTKRSALKVQPLFINVIGFGLLALIMNTAFLIKDLSSSKSFENSLIYILAAMGRLVYYIAVFYTKKASTFIQSVLISTFPLIYSIVTTEIFIYTSNKDQVLVQIFSTISGLLIMTQHTLYSFIYAMIPSFISYIYPFIRVGCNNFSNLIVDSRFLILQIINAVLSNLVCGYFLRKSEVENLSELYINETIIEQWKKTMNVLSSGELILSNTTPPYVLYCNSAFKSILKKIAEKKNEEPTENMVEAIDDLVVKGFKTRSNGTNVDIREKLTDIIKSMPDLETENFTSFLDNTELIIEVKINKLLFNKREASIISFIDCSSASEIEKFKTECKHKTILISSISHELRTPVNYILNALDLVASFLPSESINLLEMSKECCNMIIAHINDLTVNLSTTLGLWKIL